MQQERQHARQAVSITGTVAADADAAGEDCAILDLSAGGARLRPARPLAAGTTVYLGFGRLGRFPATVAWSRPPDAGVTFTDSPERMGEVVLALTLYGT